MIRITEGIKRRKWEEEERGVGGERKHLGR